MRSKRRRQIIGLLNRYLFIDFAIAVSKPRAERKDHLRAFLNRSGGNWPSYRGFRSQIGNIMGVARGLDPSGDMSFEDIRQSLKIVCKRDDLGLNVELAKLLYEFVRPQKWAAYDDHHRNPLYFGLKREIPMNVQHYIVDGERGAFQFVYPRATQLSPDELNICLSLIYYNYVSEDADFGEFDVEMVDLSRPRLIGPRGGVTSADIRVPRLHRLSRTDIVDRDILNEEADTIYQFLMEIAEEPEE